MAQLPGFANAVVADAKITDYLLNDAHPNNGGKAKFFMAFGFTPANWQELKNALLDHPRNNPYVSTTTTLYGEKYEVQCSLLTPDTRNPCVRSFWIVLAANPSPQFITGYAALLQVNASNPIAPTAARRSPGLYAPEPKFAPPEATPVRSPCSRRRSSGKVI